MPTIIEDLKRTVFRIDAPPFYGWVTLAEVVADVDAGAALYRIDDDGHCMWEIVLHAAYWRREVAHALSGGVVARLVEERAGGGAGRGPANWPALPEVRDEAHWQADRQLLDAAEAALLAALDAFDIERWSELPTGGGKAGGEWSLGQLAIGLIAHDAYHIGQAVMLKKVAQLGLK